VDEVDAESGRRYGTDSSLHNLRGLVHIDTAYHDEHQHTDDDGEENNAIMNPVFPPHEIPQP